MAIMSGAVRSAVRLLIVQASWTYERLQGVGVGFAALPLLEPLETDPTRYRAAVARAAEYFNAHPYLAGIAVGASVRAELDGVNGATIQRLKTALAGPLGSLGDQLFWIGVVPATMGAMLIAVALGAALNAVLVGLGLYLISRLAVTVWGLRLGLRSGLGVATALKQSGLADQVRRVGLVAGFIVGAALPIATRWFATPMTRSAVMVAVAIGLVGGMAAALAKFRVPTSRRFTLIAMGGVLLWYWSFR